ncbi:MAG: M20/M25/M40 family metallo-hydrolase [Clostridiales bacterium]|nr:M20/M25/M40 family metallo-hydrolase [Clostridiales bacterium]
MSLNRLLDALQARTGDLLKETVQVTEVPAPPFQEEARSRHVARRFRELGYPVEVDDLFNVVAEIHPAEGPTLLVAAHLDTVFPPGTDVRVRVEGTRAYAPGIRDNSAAVAILLQVAAAWKDAPLTLPYRLLFAANVGEEGLGDLRGIRHLVENLRPDAVVAFDGRLGAIVHEAVGSRRVKATYRGPGGHSFGDFGRPSALHAMGTFVHRFTQIPVPSQPRTTLNVGTLRGGTSVNAIAEEAEAYLDMRSVDERELEKLFQEAQDLFFAVAREKGLEGTFEVVGNRPAGRLPSSHPLLLAAQKALAEGGFQPHTEPGSTDANIPLAKGIPALCLGATTGGGAHTLKEYLEIPSLLQGAQTLVRFLALLPEEAFQRA